MAEKDMFIMSQRDLRRLHIIRQVIEKQLSRQEAARILGLCKKQIGRIVKRVKEEGDGGICHRSRGRASTRSKPQAMKERALLLYQEKYSGDGPTFASEKLADRHRIPISDETLRLWLIAASIPYPRRRKRPHRQWRERKHYRGEMVQMDGSHHDWFEGRRAPCVLMGYVDDATGTVYARFYEYEGTLPALDSFQRYIRQYGIPQSLYLDKHSTYKSQVKLTIEEELSGAKQYSQFERACAQLGTTVIHAHSPQAKGRVERVFRTLQDRLVKELRLQGISDIDSANAFLSQFRQDYNHRFAVAPRSNHDAHRPLHKSDNLDLILTHQENRTLSKNLTVQFNHVIYQIQSKHPDYAMRKAQVTVCENAQGEVTIRYKNNPLAYTIYQKSPHQAEVVDSKTLNRHINIPKPPAPDHPWRHYGTHLNGNPIQEVRTSAAD
jgi:transposase